MVPERHDSFPAACAPRTNGIAKLVVAKAAVFNTVRLVGEIILSSTDAGNSPIPHPIR